MPWTMKIPYMPLWLPEFVNMVLLQGKVQLLGCLYLE
jgi:hypothetical protein